MGRPSITQRLSSPSEGPTAGSAFSQVDPKVKCKGRLSWDRGQAAESKSHSPAWGVEGLPDPPAGTEVTVGLGDHERGLTGPGRL